MRRKPTKAANGAGSVKWYPSMRRIVGQVRRNGEVFKVYGKVGDNSAVEKAVVTAKLKPYRTAPAGTDPRMTVEDALDVYSNRKEISPSTRDCYKRTKAYFSNAFLAKRVIQVQAADIVAALDGIVGERGKPMARTRQIAYKLLRVLFDRAKDDGLIDVNPVRNSSIAPPRYHREEKTRVFTRIEQRFIREAEVARGGGNLAYLLLGLSMPVRPCEALGLRRCDIDLRRRKAHIGHDLVATKETGYKPVLGPVKTPESNRDIFLSEEVAAALSKLFQAHLAAGAATPESFVFTADHGGCVDYSRFFKKWWKPLLSAAAVEAEKAAREAGDMDYRFPKDAGLYALRHTAIENLKAAGVRMDVIHRLAGHSKLQTTMEHYNEPTDARKLDAAETVGQWLALGG